MSLQDIKYLAAILRDIKIKEIHFFDLGEPFYSDNIKKEIEILKKYNPSALIYTSTNALLIDTQQKKSCFDV